MPKQTKPLPFSDYQTALDYLYRFATKQKRISLGPTAAMHKLNRMRALLTKFANPQEKLPLILVGGTKGKGSVCAMLESIFRSAGYRTGLWTSPHLHSYRERIQVNRQLISPQDLVAGITQLYHLLETFETSTHGQPITFELGLALALDYFVAQSVQIGLIEVGLGGRYDSTNVIKPCATLITSISYDHMEILGKTLTEIARDKAGLMKPGIPTLTGPQVPEVAVVLAQEAQTVGSPLWWAEEKGIYAAGQDESLYPFPPKSRLRGAFQTENARLAMGAALLLRKQGFALPYHALAEGLATVQWPGRLEVAREAPLIILDGAHNGDSAQKLYRSLKAEFSFERLLLVLGTSSDKDVTAIVTSLVPHAQTLLLTHADHRRAEADLPMLANLARPFFEGSQLLLTNGVANALTLAQALARPNDLICVTGSLFVVGEAREALGLDFPTP